LEAARNDSQNKDAEDEQYQLHLLLGLIFLHYGGTGTATGAPSYLAACTTPSFLPCGSRSQRLP
jgi:hypothetical protein